MPESPGSLPAEHPSEDSDDLLASLLEQLIAEVEKGQSPDIEKVAREHPHVAEELRELWATAQLAHHLVEPSHAPENSSALHSASMNSFEGTQQEVGDYALFDQIGRGGMGIVYRAKQKSLGRVVALKMILRGAFASPADLSRFRSEAESAAKLNHANIVPVYEVGEHEGQPYFSMQLIEGTTLTQRLANGPLPPREAAEILLPICRAVAEAHRQGVLHRDLKPSNILIRNDGHPFISDFGLAKQIQAENMSDNPNAATVIASLTHSGDILGTPSYMAPEQAAGRRGKISTASDVYSLGAILYAILTGRPPFQAAHPVDTVLMVLEQDPVPPRILNPRADRDLEMIALKCLQKPADLRYTDADALANDLEAFLANEPIAARSSHISQIIMRAFRETHHASVLENWGNLWMLHSGVLLATCLVTNAMQLSGIESRLPYFLLWIGGLGIWASVFWWLRHRAGPITFVERQIAHIWAGSMAASALLYVVEWQLSLNVLELSPVLGLINGIVFLMKAGILTGAFYVQAIVLFLTGIAMAVIQVETAKHGFPNFSIALFGVVSAASFFFPGLKYARQRKREFGKSASG